LQGSSLRLRILATVLFFMVVIAVVLVVEIFLECPRNPAQCSTLESSPLAILFTVVAFASFPLFGYAAYWSFGIRRALSVPLYRRQAFGIGLIAANEAIVDPLNHALGGGLGDVYVPVFLLIQSYLLVIWFYWIDASVLAGRRSDPLLRDTIHWSRLRRLLWPLILVLVAIPVGTALYFQLVTGSLPEFVIDWASLQVVSSSPSQLALDFFGYSYQAIIWVFAAAALVLTALRSKDMRLRRQLEWFGAYSLISIFVYTVGNTNFFVHGTLESVLFGSSILAQAYFIYRAARSLAPVGHLPAIDPESAPP
jgi:hypothetical protein